MSSLAQRKVAAAKTPAESQSAADQRTALHKWQPLLLLCTGTLVVMTNQVVSNQASTDPQAQLLTLVRYLFTFTLSAILVRQERSSRRHANSEPENGRLAEATSVSLRRRTMLLLVLAGALDLVCYAIYNLGFALCGSAVATIVLAATGQIATAVLSVVILKCQLRPRHIAAVAIVTVGLVLRSMDELLAPSAKLPADSMQTSRQTYGALCVMLSALLFSMLGILYEMRGEVDVMKLSQAQTSFAASGVSLALTLTYQLLYVVPSWQHLVKTPFLASGLSIQRVLLAHGVYGIITAAHQYVQLLLLSSHGAMTVGLVNAVRASVVSVVSSWLFCAAKPQLCLTYWRGISGVVVTLGAVQWVFAGKPLTSKQFANKQE